MDLNQVFSDLKNHFSDLEIYQNHPLASYTTVKIGGPVDIFIKTKDSDEFLNVLEFLDKDIPITILGNGSNTLISDSGIRGVVIKNDAAEMEILPHNRTKVSSGAQLSALINFTLNHQLLGLEEFAYIPSTLGGAIFGNIHGVDKNNFSHLLESIEVFDLDSRTPKTFLVSDLDWNYDSSSFQDHPDWVITSAILKLKSGNSNQAKSRVSDIIQKKSANQPMNSLGSVFKNPTETQCLPFWGERKAAGWIIDQELHALGKTFAYAQISQNHGNFIVNLGSATAKDYLELITWIQSQMQIKFGFEFDLEIKLLGTF
jgi:UDP-N-acetylmuramate dehydrogenase